MGKIRDNIRAERARRNMTQQELAEKSGLSKASVYMYEAGKTTPSAYNISRIAEALNVGVDKLIS